jgi:hypothetical protein
MIPRRIVLLLILLVLVGALVLVIISRSAPTASTVQVSENACVSTADNAACIRFPTVTGANLLGTEFTLPDDFAGQYALVIMPFDEDQQIKAQTWLPLAQELNSPTLAYYNIPTLKEVAAPIRAFITAGMGALISDEHLREVTIMLFLQDKQLFLDALAIPDTENIQVFLLNTDGEVLWRASGDFNPDKGAALKQTLERLPTP